jgi:hypothetical protein
MNHPNTFEPAYFHGRDEGYRWAKKFDPFQLKPVAEGEIYEEIKTEIQPVLGPDDYANLEAFWGGFSHGVAADLSDRGITVRTPPPPKEDQGSTDGGAPVVPPTDKAAD